LLDAGGHEEGPQRVGELRGEEEDRQRDAWRGALGREPQPEVADEHPSGPQRPAQRGPQTLLEARILPHLFTVAQRRVEDAAAAVVAAPRHQQIGGGPPRESPARQTAALSTTTC